MGSGGVAPPFISLTVNGSERWASYLCLFTPCTHCIGSLVWRRENRKILQHVNINQFYVPPSRLWICNREVLISNLGRDDVFSCFPLVFPGKFRVSTSIRPLLLPSISFPIHYSPTILPFVTVQCRYSVIKRSSEEFVVSLPGLIIYFLSQVQIVDLER
jgi:hypothetical protein